MGSIDTLVFFPIADQILVSVHFIPSQLRALSQEELDKRVSRKTMHELMENIIDSFQLELSSEAKAAQEKALKGLDDTSLVKDFPPLKWGDTSDTDASTSKKLEQQ